MKTGGLIIMSRCLASQLVDGVARLDPLSVSADRVGESAARLVSWSEEHGDSETSIWECWRQVAPNIFVVMSPKK